MYADPVLARVSAIVFALPDARVRISHGRPAFYTRKLFAVYGGTTISGDDGMHVDHPCSLLLRAADDEELHAMFKDARCFFPSYYGSSGWFGLDLDRDEETDWQQIAELVESSYRISAPPASIRRLDERA